MESTSRVSIPGELNGTVVIHLSYRERADKSIAAVFSVRILHDHNAITYAVGVGLACGIFPVIVLADKLLLAFLDAFPVRLERDIEEGVSPKD